MLSREEKQGLIAAYKPLIVSRNAVMAVARVDNDQGLVARLKEAQRHDWETVGRLKQEIKELACEGVKKCRR